MTNSPTTLKAHPSAATTALNTSDLPPASTDDVSTPPLSTGPALARFEFAPGRGNAGTKVLMVEWDDTAATSASGGAWHVGWEGKSRHVLPAAGESAKTNRLYFLLPPGVAVPGIVTLTHRPAGADGTEPDAVWTTNPLPAIFPAALTASSSSATTSTTNTATAAASPCGVLHTLWAKRRLRALAAEIAAEASANPEGVGAAMAERERDWIESEFGVTLAPSASSSAPSTGTFPPDAPASPRSPNAAAGPTRFAEKMRGLRLGTTAEDLGPANGDAGAATTENPDPNPLSPETADVAVGAFAAFRGPAAGGGGGGDASRRVVAAQPPPPGLRAAEVARVGDAGMASLDAVADGDVEFRGANGAAGTGEGPAEESEAEAEALFALPISPRSPEMGRSPFSFGRAEAGRGKGAGKGGGGGGEERGRRVER